MGSPGHARARQEDRRALEDLERTRCGHRDGVDRSSPHRLCEVLRCWRLVDPDLGGETMKIVIAAWGSLALVLGLRPATAVDPHDRALLVFPHRLASAGWSLRSGAHAVTQTADGFIWIVPSRAREVRWGSLCALDAAARQEPDKPQCHFIVGFVRRHSLDRNRRWPFELERQRSSSACQIPRQWDY